MIAGEVGRNEKKREIDLALLGSLYMRGMDLFCEISRV